MIFPLMMPPVCPPPPRRFVFTQLLLRKTTPRAKQQSFISTTFNSHHVIVNPNQSGVVLRHSRRHMHDLIRLLTVQGTYVKEDIKEDLYKVIGVSPSISQSDLLKAIDAKVEEMNKQLIQAGTDKQKIEELQKQWELVAKAYDILGTPPGRREYDEQVKYKRKAHEELLLKKQEFERVQLEQIAEREAAEWFKTKQKAKEFVGKTSWVLPAFLLLAAVLAMVVTTKYGAAEEARWARSAVISIIQEEEEEAKKNKNETQKESLKK